LEVPVATTNRRYKYIITVSLLNDYVTAVLLLELQPGSRSGLRHPLELLEGSRFNAVPKAKARDDGIGYRNINEIPQGRYFNEG
jgi:hypothetical protein